MDEIRKLIKIVSNRAEKNAFGVDLDLASENPSLEEIMYLGARDGLYITDDDASFAIYNADSSDHRFRMLKSRLKSKLLNLLFLVDFKVHATNPTWQIEQDCENHLQRAKILLKCGEYEMAEKQINKAISISRDCEYTHITIESLRLLRLIYSERFKPTDFYRLIEDLNTMIAVQQVEDEAQNIYAEVSMNLRKSLYSRKKNLEDAGRAVERLYDLYKKYPTFNVFERYYRLKSLWLDYSRAFDEVVKTTDEASKLLDEGKLNSKRFDLRYNYFMKTYALLRSSRFEDGLRVASEGMDYFDPDSSNWFSHMENYMLLAMYSKSYKMAQELIGRVSRNPYLNQLDQRLINRWQLFNDFLCSIVPSDSLLSVFDFDQYFVPISEYNKENRNFNTSVLILELLKNLKEGSLDRVKDKVEIISQFMKLHYSDPGLHPREKLFIKLLKSLQNNNFDPQKSINKSAKYLDKLNEIGDQSDTFADIEIITYQHIWEYMIEMLDKRSNSQ